MKNFLQTTIVVCFLLLCVGMVNGADLGITTGSETGTYFRIGQDLSTLMKNSSHNLKVHTSKGSIENVYRVFKEPNSQLGIVQSDVLAYIATNEDSELKRIASKTKMVYPLYNEEVHILGKNTYKNFEELAGKKVAVGKPGSGSNLTATLFLQLSGLKLGEALPVGGTKALDMLKKGEIDAMFYVAGFPVKLLKEQVKLGDNLDLLEVNNKSIKELYGNNSSIPAGTYEWQKEGVNTIAVKAVLVSYDYRRDHCKNIHDVATLIRKEFQWLKSNGHAKWAEVDLDFKLNGWDQYPCVTDGKSDSDLSNILGKMPKIQ